MPALRPWCKVPSLTILERLLEPHDVAAFLREHWNRRALHIRGHTDKWSAWYRPVAWEWVEHALELEAASSEGGVQRQLRIDPTQITEKFDSGHTICANVSADPALAPLLARFGHELALAGTAFAKIYASPHASGFALHFDMYHVFVLQLAGKKRWRISDTPAVAEPICSGKLDDRGIPVWSFPREGEPIATDDGHRIQAPADDALTEVVLHEGDCLYLPPGTWHVASAIERSVAVSLSPPRTPVFQLVAKTLEDHLMEHADWRRDVFTAEHDAPAGTVPRGIADQLDGRIDDLRALLDTLDRRTLHRVWRLNVPTPLPATPTRARSVGRDDTLCHASAELGSYLVAPEPGGADAIFFYASGSEWSLPIEALRFIEALAGTQRFVAKDACAWDAALSWSDVQRLLEQLVKAGLLRHDAH